MIVLDASTVLVVIYDEPGAAKVTLMLEEQSCAMSAANRSEVVTVLIDGGWPYEAALNILDALEIQTIPFTREDANIAAALRPRTRSVGLGLGDRACLATAIRRDLAVLTADRIWAGLDLPIVVDVVR